MPINEDIDNLIDEMYLWSTSIVTGGGAYWILSKFNVAHDISFVVALFIVIVTISKVNQ